MKAFFSEYGGKYKFVSTQELIDIIRRRNGQPTFIFEYVLSSADNFVGVLEVQSGAVAHRQYKPLKYNIKSKDIKEIL